MKYEWKKHDKPFYGAKEQPSIVIIPNWNFITIDGEGDPNKDDFAQRVGVLYSLAYQLKFRYKALCAGLAAQAEYDDYAVPPLEGIWSCQGMDFTGDKSRFIYTIMIRQPEFITKAMFEEAHAIVARKKPHPLLGEVAFRPIEDGQCVQLLHKGPFDDEPASFSKMDQFIMENGFERLNSSHREIYLSDARKTAPEKLRTILRYQIHPKE